MLKELFFPTNKPSYNSKVIDILRLIRSENVGIKTFFNLIEMFGSAKDALENVKDLSIKGGRSKPIKIFTESEAQREIEELDKNNAKIICYDSPIYSLLLKQIIDLPPILSYKGNINLMNKTKTIAIVGARNASMNGKNFAAKLSSELMNADYTIASGLARGIDTAAHLAGPDKTIAVIAGGIDHIYPLENHYLYHKIAEEGLILAELPVGTNPLGQHFPQRNRIISGLSLGTVVVEAGLKSGSLITAKFALEHNREIFAVPGFPLDPRCTGPNKLIKDGAHLIESIDDIINNLPPECIEISIQEASNDNDCFKINNVDHLKLIDNTTRQQILEMISASAIEINQIALITKLPLPVIYMVILELELAGKVARSPGDKIFYIYN